MKIFDLTYFCCEKSKINFEEFKNNKNVLICHFGINPELTEKKVLDHWNLNSQMYFYYMQKIEKNWVLDLSEKKYEFCLSLSEVQKNEILKVIDRNE